MQRTIERTDQRYFIKIPCRYDENPNILDAPVSRRELVDITICTFILSGIFWSGITAFGIWAYLGFPK